MGETVTEIYKVGIDSEVSKGGALRMLGASNLKPEREEDREQFQKKLESHVVNKLHARTTAIQGAMTAPKKKPKKPAAGRGKTRKPKIAAMADGMMDGAIDSAMDAAKGTQGKKGDEDEEAGPAQEVDGLCEMLSIDTYVACRVRPLTDYLERRAQVMARRSTNLEFCVIMFNTLGAVLAVLGEGYADYIAITVAIAAVCMALTDYFYIPSQLAATNKALQECHNLLSWWDSLSLVQRKTRSAKKTACLTMEGAILALCSARTATDAKIPGEAVEEEP